MSSLAERCRRALSVVAVMGMGMAIATGCGSDPDTIGAPAAPASDPPPAETVVATDPPGAPSGPSPATTPPPSAEPPSPEPPATEPPADRVPLCTEIERLAPNVIGEVGGMENPDPVVNSAAVRYGAQYPDTFAGMWIDRDHGGTIVLAFTDDPVPHLEALLAFRTVQEDAPQMANPPVVDTIPLSEYPYAFDVVRAEFSEAELRHTQELISPLMSSGEWDIQGSGTLVTLNRVSLSIRYVSEDDLVALAEIVPSDRVCVEGQIGEAPVFDPDVPLEIIPDDDTDSTVECGGVRFLLSAVAEAVPIEELEDPAVDAFLADPSTPDGWSLPTDGWVLLERTADTAVFARLRADSTGFARYELTPAGWTARGAGVGSPCEFRAVLPEGLETVTWELDPAFPAPGPADTVVHVLAMERGCASGEPMGDRLRGPEVVETDTAVLVAFAVVTKGGGTCPGNPSEAVEVHLAEPLGDRVLRDGLIVEIALP